MTGQTWRMPLNKQWLDQLRELWRQALEASMTPSTIQSHSEETNMADRPPTQNYDCARDKYIEPVSANRIHEGRAPCHRTDEQMHDYAVNGRACESSVVPISEELLRNAELTAQHLGDALERLQKFRDRMHPQGAPPAGTLGALSAPAPSGVLPKLRELQCYHADRLGEIARVIGELERL